MSYIYISNILYFKLPSTSAAAALVEQMETDQSSSIESTEKNQPLSELTPKAEPTENIKSVTNEKLSFGDLKTMKTIGFKVYLKCYFFA